LRIIIYNFKKIILKNYNLKKIIFSRATYLYLINFSNYIIPVFSIPYLSRILDKDNFGLLGFGQSISILIFIFLDYGLNISGVRMSSKFLGKSNLISNHLSSIYSFKILVSIFLFSIFMILYLFGIFNEQKIKFILFALISGIFTGLNPFWYYQAKGELKHYSFFSILLKILGLVFVFLIVKSPTSGWIVLAIQSVISFLLFIYLFIPLFKKYKFFFARINSIKNNLLEYFPIFLFSVFSSIHSTASIFLLNIFLNPSSLAIYVGAEKIQKFFMGIISPLEKALLPMAFKTKNNSNDIFFTSLTLLGGIGLLCGVFVFIFSDYLVAKVLSNEYLQSIDLLKILSLQLPISAINRVLGVQNFLSKNMDVLLLKIVIIVGVIHLMTILLFVPKFGYISMAYTTIISESIFLILFLLFFKKIN
tara:strand:+ start:1039 stop:2298 length:1260 start_codon:yes stop_codon:yes gene_type:complete